MTDSQLQALQALVGRSLTPGGVRQASDALNEAGG